MKVRELIEKLRELPQDAEVWHLWDGAARTQIQVVYLGKGGRVITADWEMVAYSDESRPLYAPTSEQDPYWETPEPPKGD